MPPFSSHSQCYLAAAGTFVSFLFCGVYIKNSAVCSASLVQKFAWFNIVTSAILIGATIGFVFGMTYLTNETPYRLHAVHMMKDTSTPQIAAWKIKIAIGGSLSPPVVLGTIAIRNRQSLSNRSIFYNLSCSINAIGLSWLVFHIIQWT